MLLYPSHYSQIVANGHRLAVRGEYKNAVGSDLTAISRRGLQKKPAQFIVALETSRYNASRPDFAIHPKTRRTASLNLRDRLVERASQPGTAIRCPPACPSGQPAKSPRCRNAPCHSSDKHVPAQTARSAPHFPNPTPPHRPSPQHQLPSPTKPRPKPLPTTSAPKPRHPRRPNHPPSSRQSLEPKDALQDPYSRNPMRQSKSGLAPKGETGLFRHQKILRPRSEKMLRQIHNSLNNTEATGTIADHQISQILQQLLANRRKQLKILIVIRALLVNSDFIDPHSAQQRLTTEPAQDE